MAISGEARETGTGTADHCAAPLDVAVTHPCVDRRGDWPVETVRCLWGGLKLLAISRSLDLIMLP